MQVQAGECWGILGRNGVGKTTLLLTLAGLRAPQAGSVLWQGVPRARWQPRQAAQFGGVMLQDSEDIFPASVLETILIGRHPFLETWAWESAADLDRARHALHTVELVGFEKRMVNTLSGGERRRLALATLLVQDPSLLLLDEPVNHLDLRHQVQALDLLTQQARQGKAVCMVLHDVNLAARYCDKVLLLFGENEVIQGSTREVLTRDNLTRLYGHAIDEIATPDGALYFPIRGREK